MEEKVYPVDLNIDTLLVGDEIIAFEEGSDSPYYAEVVSLSSDKKEAEVRPFNNNPEDITKVINTSDMYDVVRLIKLNGDADFFTPQILDLEVGDEVALKKEDKGDVLYGNITSLDLTNDLVTVEWDNGDTLEHPTSDLLVYEEFESIMADVPNLIPLSIDNCIIGEAVAFEDNLGTISYGEVTDINIEDATVTVAWEDGESTIQEINELYKIIDENHPDYIAE